jgi:hypothetical protein
MHVPKLTLTLSALLPLLACDMPSSDEGGGGDSGDDGAATEPAAETDPQMPGDDSGSSSEGGGPGDDTVDDTGGDTDTGVDPASDCSEASLFMGSPYFTGDLEGWNPAGQGLLAEPPLRSRHLAVVGAEVAVETQFEVWITGGEEVRRIAGDELELEEQYQPSGACADVRLLKAAGIEALPNGNLVVADTRGNGVIELQDPTGTCTAAPIAGNPDLTLDVDVSNGAAAAGDIDGPGAEARFFGVERPISDAEGNIYVVDTGNAKIKRIAADADRTVSTIDAYAPEESPWGLTVLDGTLYVSGSNGTEDLVWAIDLEAGTKEVLYQGRGLFEEIDSTKQAQLVALTHDGVDLLVASAQGYVFRLSTSAEPLGVVAGYGSITDYPTDLDLTMPIPTAELPIRSYALGDGSLVRHGDDLLFTGNANGVGFHVWSIHCM